MSNEGVVEEKRCSGARSPASWACAMQWAGPKHDLLAAPRAVPLRRALAKLHRSEEQHAVELDSVSAPEQKTGDSFCMRFCRQGADQVQYGNELKLAYEANSIFTTTPHSRAVSDRVERTLLLRASPCHRGPQPQISKAARVFRPS
jgi:hypothetical protein